MGAPNRKGVHFRNVSLSLCVCVRMLHCVSLCVSDVCVSLLCCPSVCLPVWLCVSLPLGYGCVCVVCVRMCVSFRLYLCVSVLCFCVYMLSVLHIWVKI